MQLFDLNSMLTCRLAKQLKDRRPFDIGLNRQGAVRQRKEEIHEKQGHKFVTQQFYNIMRCALCGDFLKYAAGMQCADCKYTCHRKCYPKVVTKCISKANYETDPDEEKINHRIPHRWDGFSNISANWCCHCGYLLPFGRKNAKRCSECGLTCHANCTHLVPDFCGMSMEAANQILETIIRAKHHNKSPSVSSGLSGKTLRPGGAPQDTSHAYPKPVEGPHSYGALQRPPSSDAMQADLFSLLPMLITTLPHMHHINNKELCSQATKHRRPRRSMRLCLTPCTHRRSNSRCSRCNKLLLKKTSHNNSRRLGSDLIISTSLLFLERVTSVKSCWQRPRLPGSCMPSRF
ncbi:hypothetical protein BJX61DRAFT_85697 [Aspergillus egyptiacus]|nr:hypothetical protein BJX61DRAFT_85697 [Aspergillus egyptiacus]